MPGIFDEADAIQTGKRKLHKIKKKGIRLMLDSLSIIITILSIFTG